MIVVSCRKNFWDNEELADPGEWKNQIAAIRGHRTKEAISLDDLAKYVTNRRALLLVHGYNNEKDKVLKTYQIINANEKRWIAFYDLVMGFTWPGGDNFSDYKGATKRVSASSNSLKGLLHLLGQHCSVVDVMSHSLGGRVSLSAFQALSDGGHAFGNTTSRQFLFAAAVHHDSIQKGQPFYDGSGHSEKCCAFYTHDSVICSGYSLFEGGKRALGCNGPENRKLIHNNVNLVGCQKIVKRHGSEKKTKKIFKYIRKIVNREQVPRFYNFR